MNYIIFTAVLLLVFVLFADSGRAGTHKHLEKYYQEKWCAGIGIMEIVLPDRSRVDCLTKNFAVEFDFAPKWKESIGQVLNYAYYTDRNAAIVLIVERPKDYIFVFRLK